MQNFAALLPDSPEEIFVVFIFVLSASLTTPLYIDYHIVQDLFYHGRLVCENVKTCTMHIPLYSIHTCTCIVLYTLHLEIVADATLTFSVQPSRMYCHCPSWEVCGRGWGLLGYHTTLPHTSADSQWDCFKGACVCVWMYKYISFNHV